MDEIVRYETCNLGTHVGVISLTLCIVLQNSFILANVNSSPSPEPRISARSANGSMTNVTFPSCNVTIPSCNVSLPIPCVPYTDLVVHDMIVLHPVFNLTRQAVNVTCSREYYTLIGPHNLECVDGHWFPSPESVSCASPCTGWNTPPNMRLEPHLPPEAIVLHQSIFQVQCQPLLRPVPGRGGPPPTENERRGDLLCYDGRWYLSEEITTFQCIQPALPTATDEATEAFTTMALTTVEVVQTNCSVSANMTGPSETLKDTTFSSSIVYALSALVGILVIVVLMLLVCLCRSRRNDNAKRMKKSGFRDQLSIFQKPAPLNLPPKLPERPITVGSVGSLRYQEQPKLPGQKIAEEEEEARKIEAIRTEIYEQIGRRSDQPEYIDLYQTK